MCVRKCVICIRNKCVNNRQEMLRRVREVCNCVYWGEMQVELGKKKTLHANKLFSSEPNQNWLIVKKNLECNTSSHLNFNKYAARVRVRVELCISSQRHLSKMLESCSIRLYLEDLNFLSFSLFQTTVYFVFFFFFEKQCFVSMGKGK